LNLLFPEIKSHTNVTQPQGAFFFEKSSETGLPKNENMLKHLIPTITLFLWLTLPLSAQNCGCEQAGNCPADIPPNATTQICYSITDAVNNSLSDPNQGVCGVSVQFKHGSVGQLEMSLTAPDGTTVQLVGSAASCSPFTPIAFWNILFIPCADPCSPVNVGNCAGDCTFDACCGWGNGLYTGTYHPFSGCLEDFNTGPANGQWCLNIANNAIINGGDLIDFEVILCDDTGIFCCEADAGSKLHSNTAACVGDSSLIFNLTPKHGLTPPDTMEYGYQYIISRNDTILQYTDSPDLISAPEGLYQICGLSYLKTDQSLIPPPGSWLLSDLQDTLNSMTNPLFCGDVGGCFTVLVSDPPAPVFITDSICAGECLMVGDSCFSEAGSYTLTIPSFAGCDSIVNVTLTVLSSDTTYLSGTICSGNSFAVGDSLYTQSGIFSTPLINQFGCDSLVILDLSVLPPMIQNLTDTICFGDSVSVGSSVYFETGMYADTLLSFNQCDSIVLLDLTVIELQTTIAPPDTISCNSPAIWLDATGSSVGSDVGYLWTSPNDGHFLSPTNQLTVQVDSGGWYFFQIETGGCPVFDSVFVEQNVAPPLIQVTPADTLNCLVQVAHPDASLSSGMGTLSFQWESSAGWPIVDSLTATPSVFHPDLLKLTVTDAANGCLDSVFVEIVQDTLPPVANAGNADNLTCADTCLTLDASASTPAGLLTFEWSGGHIKSGQNTPNPVVNLSAPYELIVTNIQNHCRDTATVFIGIDTIPPLAIIQTPTGDTLTCAMPVLTLDGSSSGTGLLYDWAGNVSPANDQPVVQISEPGTYFLSVENSQNGCRDTAQVFIEQDTLPPTANAGPPIELDCGLPTFVLGGNNMPVPEFDYMWHSADGHFLDDPNQLHPTIDSAGTYILTVTNPVNGCLAQDSVTIFEDFAMPVADAGPDGIIDCNDPVFILDASNTYLEGTSFNDTILFVFEWTALFNPDFHPGYAIVSTNFPDTFIVQATHITSQCSDTDTVIVTQTVFPPAIDAGPDVVLDCETGTAVLSGTIPDPASNFDFSWETPDGHFGGGTNTLAPTVDATGTYILEVLDLTTNCVATDTVLAQIDTALCTPFVFAGNDSLINCYCQCLELTIPANGSTGNFYDYEWRALNGDILPQTDPFLPQLPAGTFIFTITNMPLQLSASDTVTIAIDTLHPVVDLPDLISLSCPEMETCVPIDVSGIPFGMQYSYLWENFGGEICTDPTVRNVEVRGEGVYSLEVTNTLNGCVSGTGTILEISGAVPIADAGANLSLPCGDSTSVLDCSGSVFGANDIIQWFSNSGTFESATDICDPAIRINNSRDTFFLTIQNPDNLCADTSSVVVFAATDCFPQCDAGPNQSFNCLTDSITLNGFAAPLDTNVYIYWTALTGNIASGDSTLTPVVDQPGIYRLTVTRIFDGVPFSCSDDLQITPDTFPPPVSIQVPGMLSCKDSVLTLTGSPSPPGYLYAWQTSDGNILGDSTDSALKIDAPGTYSLTVTDLSNGCVASEMATVLENLTQPSAVISPASPPEIDCDGNPITLSASGSSSGSYQWTTIGGNIITNPPTGSVIQVDAAGKYCLTVTHPGSGCTDSICVDVGVNADAPQCNVLQAPDFICGTTSIQLTGSAGGAPLLEYHWTTPNGGPIQDSTTLTPTVFTPGTYVLNVTNPVNNCKCTSSVTLLADTIPPVANAGTDQEINCNHLEVLLSGQGSQPAGDLVFEWFANNILLSQSPDYLTNTPGTYILSVTDTTNLCVDVDTVQVSIDQNIPIAEAGPDTTLTCARPTVNLTATGSSTTPGLLYIWATPGGEQDTSFNFVADSPGTYYLTVFDPNNSCLVSDSIRVKSDTISPLAVIDFPAPPVLTCDTPTILLNGALSMPFDSLTFEWSTMATAPDIFVDEGGIYTLTVKNIRNGCTASAFVEVKMDTISPQISLAAPDVLTCDRESVQIKAIPDLPNLLYSWSGGVCDSLCDTAMPWVSASDTYSVLVTDTQNGCTTTGFVFVEQDKTPPVAVANADGQIDCIQNIVHLSGEGSSTDNVQFFWATSGNGTIATPTLINTTANAPGWYFLTVTNNENGCSALDSVEVIADAVPITGINIRLDQPDCTDPDGYIFIDQVDGGTPEFMYALNGNEFTQQPQFNFLPPGAYQISVEDVNGCQYDTTVILEKPIPPALHLLAEAEIFAGDSATIQLQVSISPDAIDTIIWTPLPDPSCPTCLEQIAQPFETTTYQAMVIDTNGCRAIAQATILVKGDLPVFVPNAFSPNGDGNNDRFMIYGHKAGILVRRFQVFDRWGNLVHEAQNFRPNAPQFGWDGRLNGRDMNAQVFVWRAEIVFPDGRLEVFQGDVALIR